MRMEIRAKVDNLFDHGLDEDREQQHNEEMNTLRKMLDDARKKLEE